MISFTCEGIVELCFLLGLTFVLGVFSLVPDGADQIRVGAYLVKKSGVRAQA
jgi:hypothetical protein